MEAAGTMKRTRFDSVLPHFRSLPISLVPDKKRVVYLFGLLLSCSFSLHSEFIKFCTRSLSNKKSAHFLKEGNNEKLRQKRDLEK